MTKALSLNFQFAMPQIFPKINAIIVVITDRLPKLECIAGNINGNHRQAAIAPGQRDQRCRSVAFSQMFWANLYVKTRESA